MPINKVNKETGGLISVAGICMLPVDQTYDPTSVNAQSGAALGPVLNSKVRVYDAGSISNNTLDAYNFTVINSWIDNHISEFPEGSTTLVKANAGPTLSIQYFEFLLTIDSSTQRHYYHYYYGSNNNAYLYTCVYYRSDSGYEGWQTPIQLASQPWVSSQAINAKTFQVFQNNTIKLDFASNGQARRFLMAYQDTNYDTFTIFEFWITMLSYTLTLHPIYGTKPDWLTTDNTTARGLLNFGTGFGTATLIVIGNNLQGIEKVS